MRGSFNLVSAWFRLLENAYFGAATMTHLVILSETAMYLSTLGFLVCDKIDFRELLLLQLPLQHTSCKEFIPHVQCYCFAEVGYWHILKKESNLLRADVTCNMGRDIDSSNMRLQPCLRLLEPLLITSPISSTRNMRCDERWLLFGQATLFTHSSWPIFSAGRHWSTRTNSEEMSKSHALSLD